VVDVPDPPEIAAAGSEGGPVMASSTEGEPGDIYSFPEFFSRLESKTSLSVRDAVESETELDGIVYHHRGVQVPGHDGLFVWEPGEEDSIPTFSFELNALGSRTVWAVFDATMSWDIYLLLFDGGAVVAWMSDAEFEAEEAETFDRKAAAIDAGRFSFGAIFQFGPDWVKREDWASASTAPAMLQLGDGQLIVPETEAEFYDNARAIPVELRPDEDGTPPDHLGLVDAELSIDAEEHSYPI
jgi:hypothetical protein